MTASHLHVRLHTFLPPAAAATTMWFLMFEQSEVRSVYAAAGSLKRGQDGNEEFPTWYCLYTSRLRWRLLGGGLPAGWGLHLGLLVNPKVWRFKMSLCP